MVVVDTDDSNAVIAGPAVNEVIQAWAKLANQWREDGFLQVVEYVIGWVIDRNLITVQEGLSGRTPACVAWVLPPFAAWADVVRLEAKAHRPTSDP